MAVSPWAVAVLNTSPEQRLNTSPTDLSPILQENKLGGLHPSGLAQSPPSPIRSQLALAGDHSGWPSLGARFPILHQINARPRGSVRSESLLCPRKPGLGAGPPVFLLRVWVSQDGTGRERDHTVCLLLEEEHGQLAKGTDTGSRNVEGISTFIQLHLLYPGNVTG